MKQRRYKWLRILLAAVVLLLAIVPVGMAADEQILGLGELKGKRVAIQTGTNYDELLEGRPELHGTMQFEYFSTTSDMIQALKAGKVDAVPLDKPVAGNYCAQNPELMVLEEPVDINDFGIVFQPDSPYLRPFNEALAELKQTGVLAQLQAKWIEGDLAEKKIIVQDWPGSKGVLRYWVDTEYEPVSYIGEGGVMLGLDVDLVLHAARLMDYRVECTPCSFDGLIPAIVSNKADLVSSGIAITPERAEAISFSDPYYNSGVVVVVRNTNYVKDDLGGLLGSIKISFEKTFVRESRWMLFAQGIATTLIITLCAAILGTLLGFAVYLLCRNASGCTPVIEMLFSLLERMPIVVLLMVMYYIILGQLDLGGVTVSIVAFTLTFAAAMYGMLKTGVNAVSLGQTEAAYALGYTKRDTFFKIVLPQAARIFMPSYRSELISLVKGTSVVGYIAVQDLTKMSDIVRSRTYEAFFPLLVTAVIYMILTWLLTLFIGFVSDKIDPKRRKKESILKGVEMK